MPDDAPVADHPTDVGAFADFYVQQYEATVRLAAFLSGSRSAAEDPAPKKRSSACNLSSPDSTTQLRSCARPSSTYAATTIDQPAGKSAG